MGSPPEGDIDLESIVLRQNRPVLKIKGNTTELKFFDDLEKVLWEARLRNAAPYLNRAIPAVGRIEMVGGRLDWVGTGWLVDSTILVTNRHVAREFVEHDGETLAFRPGAHGSIRASVDFLRESSSAATALFDLKRILHIEEDPGPDVAFLRVKQVAGGQRLAKQIPLASNIQETEDAAVIGYPAYDTRIPDFDLMQSIYGGEYNIKRLAPGAVTAIDSKIISHNCTTLGGSSGSIVLDLKSGKALGLHFSGRFLRANYAVRADVITPFPELRARDFLTSSVQARRLWAPYGQAS